jgi:hypothetical protein
VGREEARLAAGGGEGGGRRELGTRRWGRRRRVGGVEGREKGGEVEKEDDTWGPQVLVGME